MFINAYKTTACVLDGGYTFSSQIEGEEEDFVYSRQVRSADCRMGKRPSNLGIHL